MIAGQATFDQRVDNNLPLFFTGNRARAAETVACSMDSKP